MPNNLPDSSGLIKRFDLLKKGRKNGSDNMPPATEPGLDPVETEVESWCHSVHKHRLEAYRKDQDELTGRMKLERPEEDADAVAEEKCQAMKNKILTAKTDLIRHREALEESRDKLRAVKEKYGLDDADTPRMPESFIKFGGTLAFLILVETLVNGIFFGANLSGGLLGGMSYAVLISLINVVALGWVVAKCVRQATHADDLGRLFGVVGLVTFVILGVLWNLAVAHYREALPSDYPPAPDSVGVVATTTATPQETEDVAGCWRGGDETAAEREALCLFRSQWFTLDSFQSYMLMLIGLMMFVAAAWKWWGKQDPYPGFGQAAQDRQRAEQELDNYVGDLLEELDRDREIAVEQQERHMRLGDPVAHYDRASDAYDELGKRHVEFCEDAEYLETSCRTAIASYRSANRAAPRTKPEPESWQTDWTANWKLPEVPAKPDIASRSDAESRAGEAKAAKEGRVRKLNDCYKECETEIRGIARVAVS